MGRKEMLTLGVLVRQARKAKGWTQEQMAHETGLSLPTISRIERDVQVPSIETLKLIARATGTSFDSLSAVA